MKSYNKKIIIFALALLILAGIIVVVLKGFNVSLDLRAHDTLKFVFTQKFEKEDVENICKDVFKDKDYKIKKVEVFTDAVYIIAPTITENEEETLLTKLNDLYAKNSDNKKEDDNTYEMTEDGAEKENVESNNNEEKTIYDKLEKGNDYDFYTDSKVRIRDMVKPYVVPSIISTVIICIYVAIKYKKLHEGKFMITVFETLGEMIVILLTLLSIVAITRIPFTSTVIPILMFIILACLIVKLALLEKALKEVE
ncbi:MAG: hypothetical protein HFJ45_00470 [Clostridia bacterium]|nr:hypothetical protein [Clostridia bacterium]